MRNISRPTETAKDAFEACISRVRKRSLRQRLESVEPIVTSTDADYQAKMGMNLLHLLPSGDGCFQGVVTTDEMVSVYKNRMVPKNSPGRQVYDNLMSLAPNGKCPLCTVGVVSTLDHILPKTLYPALVVAPLNLVPACKDCNSEKLTTSPSSAQEVFLHPYYDNVDIAKWLVARVSQPLAVTFDVSCPQNWPPLLQARVKHHFDELKLAKLFASNAASQLTILSYILEPLRLAGGTAEVKRYLNGEALGHQAAHLNSWQSAMYEALASDDWYICGGFRS